MLEFWPLHTKAPAFASLRQCAHSRQGPCRPDYLAVPSLGAQVEQHILADQRIAAEQLKQQVDLEHVDISDVEDVEDTVSLAGYNATPMEFALSSKSQVAALSHAWTLLEPFGDSARQTEDLECLAGSHICLSDRDVLPPNAHELHCRLFVADRDHVGDGERPYACLHVPANVEGGPGSTQFSPSAAEASLFDQTDFLHAAVVSEEHLAAAGTSWVTVGQWCR